MFFSNLNQLDNLFKNYNTYNITNKSGVMSISCDPRLTSTLQIDFKNNICTATVLMDDFKVAFFNDFNKNVDSSTEVDIRPKNAEIHNTCINIRIKIEHINDTFFKLLGFILK